MRKFLLSCCLLLIQCSVTVAQTLTPEQLQADFTRFRTALEEVHPGQYWYTPRPVWDSLFAATRARLNHPMTQQEFYVTMVPLLTALGDGHIKWIVTGRDEHYPFSTEKLFPLQLYFLEGKAWVRANYGDSRIPAGAELVAINGQPVGSILETLLPKMTFADGSARIGGKYEDLNRYFSGYYATFIGAPDAFKVTYRVGNEAQTATLSPVTEQQIKACVDAQKPAPQKPFRLTYADNRTAIMTIDRFLGDKKEQDYEAFLKESFQELKTKGIQNLVLDLRDNEGGEESWGVKLYSYLARQPFRYYDHIAVRQKKKYSFPAWTPGLYVKFRWLIVQKRGDGYVFTKQRGLKRVKPSRLAFGGPLYILLNGNSFSVTTEFSARVHADRRATFIGQETGGGYARNSSGIFTITQLPNSKIDLGIGMFGFHMANLPTGLKPGQGVIPDHPVAPTVEDVLSGNDRVMKYTLQLIKTQSASAGALSTRQ